MPKLKRNFMTYSRMGKLARIVADLEDFQKFFDRHFGRRTATNSKIRFLAALLSSELEMACLPEFLLRTAQQGLMMPTGNPATGR